MKISRLWTCQADSGDLRQPGIYGSHPIEDATGIDVSGDHSRTAQTDRPQTSVKNIVKFDPPAGHR
jgi:hypothetical protein